MRPFQSLLLLSLVALGPAMTAAEPPALPRIEADRQRGSEFRFSFLWAVSISALGDRLFSAGAAKVISLNLDTLERRVEFAFGEFVDPADPDSYLRILVKYANLGAAAKEFIRSYPPFYNTGRGGSFKDGAERNKFYKPRLDALAASPPKVWDLDLILQDIHAQPPELQEDRRQAWIHNRWTHAGAMPSFPREAQRYWTGKGYREEPGFPRLLWSDAIRGLDGQRTGAVGPDGRFSWIGENINFEEKTLIGNVLDRSLVPNPLRDLEMQRKRKEAGATFPPRLFAAILESVSPNGRWGLLTGGVDSSHLLIYDMKTMKLAWDFDLNRNAFGGAFSPDSKKFLVYGWMFTRVYDLENRKLEREIWINADRQVVRFTRFPLVGEVPNQKGINTARGPSDYAAFSPDGRYIVLHGGGDSATDTGLENNRAWNIYDLQADALASAIPVAEFAFRGWGPVPHSAFFHEPKGLVLRDVRDGERLLELAYPADIEIGLHHVDRALCPATREGMVLASLTRKKRTGDDKVDLQVLRWNIKSSLDGLKRQVEKKASGK